MTWMRINPVPMGTSNALGNATPAMQQRVAQAYGRMGGRKSAKKRRVKAAHSGTSRKRKRNGGRKLKFGSPAWRKKYLGKRKR